MVARQCSHVWEGPAYFVPLHNDGTGGEVMVSGPDPPFAELREMWPHLGLGVTVGPPSGTVPCRAWSQSPLPSLLPSPFHLSCAERAAEAVCPSLGWSPASTGITGTPPRPAGPCFHPLQWSLMLPYQDTGQEPSGSCLAARGAQKPLPSFLGSSPVLSVLSSA